MSAVQALAGAAGIAALELDAASVGTFLLSRPFVVGPLVGWARGDVWSGAALGAVFEAVTLAELPLGGCLEISACVAAGTSAWLASGGRIPFEACFLAGLAAGWLHARAERGLRRGRAALVRDAEDALRGGRPERLGAKIAATLTVQGAATFGVCACFLAAASAALPALWPRLPAFVQVGARTAFLAAPWIGAGGLAASLGRRA